jgi:hypothetical protein
MLYQCRAAQHLCDQGLPLLWRRWPFPLRDHESAAPFDLLFCELDGSVLGKRRALVIDSKDRERCSLALEMEDVADIFLQIELEHGQPRVLAALLILFKLFFQFSHAPPVLFPTLPLQVLERSIGELLLFVQAGLQLRNPDHGFLFLPRKLLFQLGYQQ